MTGFRKFFAFFDERVQKIHKPTSHYCGKRKFFIQKFWSHGTPQGYLGSISQPPVGLGACQFQILLIWGLDKLLTLAKNSRQKSENGLGPVCRPLHCYMSLLLIASKLGIKKKINAEISLLSYVRSIRYEHLISECVSSLVVMSKHICLNT